MVKVRGKNEGAQRPTSLHIPSPSGFSAPEEESDILSSSFTSMEEDEILPDSVASPSSSSPAPTKPEFSLQWSTTNLKRSNSAPMVNLVGRSPSPRGAFVSKILLSPGPPSRASSPGSTTVSRGPFRSSGSETKASSDAAGASRNIFSSPTTSGRACISPIRIPYKRIQNIRRESNVAGCILSDVERERLVRSSAQMSNSFETFSLDDGSGKHRARAQSLTEPISILTHFLPSSGSPSPTRVDSQKQCYSPSTQQIVRNNIAFSPRPSPRSTPSPTRQKMMRSLSPIAALSRVNRKRKCDAGDFDGLDSPKRINILPSIWAHHSLTRNPSSSLERSIQSFTEEQQLALKKSVSSSSFEETESSDSGVSSSECINPSSSATQGGLNFVFSKPEKVECNEADMVTIMEQGDS